MVTDLPSSFGHSFLDLAGVAMARKAAADCYRSSGLTPYDVNVIEVHDCFSCNEVSLDFLGLVQMHYSICTFPAAVFIYNSSCGRLIICFSEHCSLRVNVRPSHGGQLGGYRS